MTCKNLGVVGSIVNRSTPSVVRGSDSFIVTQLTFRNTDDPASIGGFVGATGQFPSSAGDGPVLVVASLENAGLGTLRYDMDAATTGLLKIGDEQSFQQLVEDDQGVRIIQFDAVLSVVASLF